MKIISWNVNSIRARVFHVKKILHDEQPTILMLQETKVQDDDFPFHEFSDMDYKMFISGQKLAYYQYLCSEYMMMDLPLIW